MTRNLVSLTLKERAGGFQMTVIELPDEQAAALRAKAAAQGLSLEAWFKKLAAAASAGPMPALDWSKRPVVESVPGRVSGAWVLKGTRMPVSAIFENLQAGASVDEIMEWYDGLDREQVKGAIEFAARSLDHPPAHER